MRIFAMILEKYLTGEERIKIKTEKTKTRKKRNRKREERENEKIKNKKRKKMLQFSPVFRYGGKYFTLELQTENPFPISKTY